MRKGLMLAAALMMPVGSVVPMQAAGAQNMMPSFVNFNADSPIIEITVRHMVEVDPDIAVMYVEVEGKGKTSDEALKALAPKSVNVTNALKPFAKQPQDFETVSSSVEADTNYNRETGEETVVGYLATTRVKITIRDLSQVSVVMDAATNAGANAINGVSFDLENKEQAELLALDQGMAKTMTRARKHAKWAGYDDVKVIWISDQIDARSTPKDVDTLAVMDAAEAAVDGPTASIIPGKVTVATQFLVRFEMVKN